MFRDKDGYAMFYYNGKNIRLHRVTMSAKYQVDYFDYSNSPRHSAGCSKDCFNPDHINIGTQKDNMQDRITHRSNPNLNKSVCSKCGGNYNIVVRKSGPRAGMSFRRCQKCSSRQNKECRERRGY